jgi:hypothetical protein
MKNKIEFLAIELKILYLAMNFFKKFMNLKRMKSIFPILIFLLIPMTIFGQGSIETNNSKIDVMVLGSLHLRQISKEEMPVSVELIRQSIEKYKPDHVVVEWLHPSIDPAETFNYMKFEDFETLSRLWGYKLDKLDESFNENKNLLEQHINLSRNSPSISNVRVELGKLHYLKKDRLNAGYQWWLADDLGADVTDLKRLTLNNFKDHELEVFGFEIARKQGIEYITPFDYQGSEAGSEVWGEMLDSLMTVALRSKYQVDKNDPNWEKLSKEFKSERQDFENNKNKIWVEKYGTIKEISEYVNVWNGFNWQNEQMPTAKDGLAQMRYLQSPKFDSVERRVQTELIPGISINGLGLKRLDGIMRRNELMLDFAIEDIKKLGKKRVLIIVGAAHKFALEDMLKGKGYNILPSADFMP